MIAVIRPPTVAKPATTPSPYVPSGASRSWLVESAASSKNPSSASASIRARGEATPAS